MENEQKPQRQNQAHTQPGNARPPQSAIAQTPAEPQRPRWHGRLDVQIALLLAAIHLLLVIHGGVHDSQTFDEGVHLAAGVSYWRTGDFRLNPEHPVLWKLIAALPVLALRPTLPIDDPSWARYQEWDFAATFMADNRVPTLRLLLFGRLPSFLAGAALIFSIFILGRRLLGAGPGLLAAFIASVDPTLIAHARYITTDIPVTLAIVLTITQLHRYVQAPTRKKLLLYFLAFVCAILVKYSGLVLLLMVPLLLAVLQRRQPLPMSIRRLTGLTAAVSVVIVFAVYGLRFERVGNDPRLNEILNHRQNLISAGQVQAQPVLIRRLIAQTDDGQPLRRAIDSIQQWRLPFYWYIRGVFAVTSHAYWGQHAYLIGQLSERGWWWYFPAAFFMKTPLGTLWLLALAVFAWFWSRVRLRQRLFPAWPWLFVPLIVYLAGSLFSRLNLGIRHLTPAYPFLFLFISTLWFIRPGRFVRAFRASLLGMLLALPLSTLLTHPREIAYFSETVGGERQGYRYLLDSNLDWGQDLLRLRELLSRRALTSIPLAYGGTAQPRSYGINAKPFPTEAQVQAGTFRGLAALSIGVLMGSPQTYAWVTAYPLVDRAGASIMVYDLDHQFIR